MIADVQPRLPAPAACAWDLVVLPVLRRITLERLVMTTGMTARHLRYLRKGKRRPSPELESRLTAEAVRWAKALLKRKTAGAQDRIVAETLLELSGGPPKAFP